MLSASYTADDAKNIDLIYDYDPTTIDREDCGCEMFQLTGSELYPERNGLYQKAELGRVDRTYRWDYRWEILNEILLDMSSLN